MNNALSKPNNALSKPANISITETKSPTKPLATTFKPRWPLTNPHIQTIYARYARSIITLPIVYETLTLPDNDILETCLLKSQTKPSKRLVILVHGLEGRADAPYMLSTAKLLITNGLDVLTWSFRGCGLKPNLQLRSYNCGFTDDLRYLIDLYKSDYQEIFLVGFSVGGNLCIKYLGEAPHLVPHNIKAAITISSPLDLEHTANQLTKGTNKIYLNYFLRSFKARLKIKQKIYPNILGKNFFKGIRNFEDYDNRFTAPWFNYRNAQEYWNEASSLRFLPQVTKPLLFISAIDDPFFAGANLPTGQALENKYLQVETVEQGGHVGFLERLMPLSSWLENRILRYLNTISGDII
jgi:hypothetical protein